MGIVYQHIRISNAVMPEIEEIDANALVDTGAAELCIPEQIARRLKLRSLEQRTVTIADGRRETVDYVGPMLVEAFGRHAFTGAMVLGDRVLLGATPLQTMDLLIDPKRHRVIPNPENPDIPGSLAMGFRTTHND